MVITTYLRDAVAHALIQQLAIKYDIPLDELLSSKPEVRDALKAACSCIIDDLNDLGIDMDLLAAQVLKSLYTLFSIPENVGHAEQELALLLWSALGNPASDPTPPPVYTKAASQCWALFCGLLRP